MSSEDVRGRLAELEAALAAAQTRATGLEALLRRALTEKGELTLRQLADAHARGQAAAEQERLDSLTGVLRHGPFRARLAYEVERSARAEEPLALVLFDLDGFRRFNEALGYEQGDHALAFVGRSLQSLWMTHPAVRPPAIGREAADCFALILPRTTAQEAAARAEAVRDLVERLPLGPPRLTASVGCVVMGPPGAAVEPDILLKAASAGLARARAEGGNRVGHAQLDGETSR